jgi:hypothetical protein
LNITNILRKNIGIIITIIGFMLLCIITFGDLGDVVSAEYWQNVANNLTSISFMTIGLTLIQVSIKQGLAEQALQRGLNSSKTTEIYESHKNIIKECKDKIIYLPYFLQIYNKRHTGLRRREFLVNNGFSSEASLFSSGDKKLIGKYRQIIVNVTAPSIKWSTVEIVYNKEGRITTLNEHRAKRIRASIVGSFVSMIGVTFLAGGLFFAPSEEPIWQKFVKLLTYIMAIAIGAVFTVIKEYEKGAFGVPNELEEINQIWYEFKTWDVPEWVTNEVEKLNECTEVENEQRKDASNGGTDLQEKQKESEGIRDTESCDLVSVTWTDPLVSAIYAEK